MASTLSNTAGIPTSPSQALLLGLLLPLPRPLPQPPAPYSSVASLLSCPSPQRSSPLACPLPVLLGWSRRQQHPPHHHLRSPRHHRPATVTSSHMTASTVSTLWLTHPAPSPPYPEPAPPHLGGTSGRHQGPLRQALTPASPALSLLGTLQPQPAFGSSVQSAFGDLKARAFECGIPASTRSQGSARCRQMFHAGVATQNISETSSTVSGCTAPPFTFRGQ